MPEYDTGIDPPETLEGKCLILGDKRFDFPLLHQRGAGHEKGTTLPFRIEKR
ncbi:MAG: hypothetical protein IKA55_03425 [Akkermansia sp.]|nr:hypothetical protein [Akkermansia sp.]